MVEGGGTETGGDPTMEGFRHVSYKKRYKIDATGKKGL